MVRLIAPIPAGVSVAEADRNLTEFASRIVPELPRFVPN
jgi:hypothetical protein